MSITLARKHFIDTPAMSDQAWGTVLTTPRINKAKPSSIIADTPFDLTVYLSTNRFTSIVISVVPSTTLLEILSKISTLGGFIMAPHDYMLGVLKLRWYGTILTDVNNPIQLLATLRLYDESSTASVHHTTPRSLSQHRQPNQTRPVKWTEAINFGAKTGSSWDVLRVRTFKSSWSGAVRIHRNALGNSGVAQLLTLVEEAEHSRLNPSKQYELALWSCYGPGAFGDTIVTTIVPRYVIINQTSHNLWYRQHKCKIVTTLHTNDMKPFHWDKADEVKKSIEVTFAEGDMDWSGPFTIHSLGTTHLKLRGKDNVHDIYILQAHLDMVGGSIVCVFRDESKRWPPYRIDNFTSFRLQFRQAQWQRDIWDEVRPRSSVPYSWDNHDGRQSVSADGNQTHVLERFLDVRFMQVSSSLSLDVTNAVVETKDYNLDMMQKHKRIQLTRSLPAALFDGCAIQATLLKKDNAFNWSKRYFRLHDHMIYYFMTESDHALRGWSKPKYKRSNASRKANPLQNMAKSITDTLFGEDIKDENESSTPFCEEYALWVGTLVRMSDRMVAKATEWIQALTLNGAELSPTQLFLVSGSDMVQFLISENLATSKYVAIEKAQQLLYFGVLGLWNPPPDIDVEDIQFESSGTLYRVILPSPPAPTTREFSISTQSKTYNLRAESPDEAASWCRHIREAMIHAMHDAHSSHTIKAPEIVHDTKTTTKTYVYARVRADGPTKVLELTEGGEEDEEGSCSFGGAMKLFDESPKEPSDPAAEWLQHIHVNVSLTSIGFSCINQQPMELVYASLQGVVVSFDRDVNKMRFGITWQDIQADNQVPEATFQTLLCPKQRDLEDKIDMSCRDCKMPQSLSAFHFCCGWSNEQGSTDYFEYCSLHISPMLFQLDEELVSLLRDFLNQVYLQRNGIRHHDLSETTQYSQMLNTRQVQTDFKSAMESEELNPLNNNCLLETHTATSLERKVYFAALNIHPVEMDITFRSDVIGDRFKAREDQADDELITDNVAAWIPSLSMHVPDLDNAPIRLNALVVEHAFGTSGDVTRRVSKYYTRQLWKQVHKILGSFDFLGNPAGLLDHLGTAVRDLIVEPFEGARAGSGIAGSGLGFGKGLAKGATSFVTNFIDGTSDATSKVTGTFGQGLATMSFDDHYQQIRAKARRRHVHGFKEGIIQGSRELTLGMMEGVTGLVMNPLRGAQSHGALGFLKGTFTGLLGLPMKPVAGVFDFASRATQGIRNRSVYHGRQGLRLPRVFGRYNELKFYKEEDVIAHMLVTKTGTDEKIIYYSRLDQMVPANELAEVARARKLMVPLHRQVMKMDRFETDDEDQERGKRALYTVVFSKKGLGLELETDFYGEAVIIKNCLDHSAIDAAETTNRDVTMKLLQPGDILVKLGDVNVRNIGFRETIALIKGSSRPIALTFESCDIFDDESANDLKYIYSPSASVISSFTRPPNDALKVKQTHWAIITDKRVLYIQWSVDSSLDDAILEWSTPLREIHSVEVHEDNLQLHLRVGVNSIFTGPLIRPEWKHETAQAVEAMNIFSQVMKKSFRPNMNLADVQEVYPSDTSFSGVLRIFLQGGNKRRRWCVLCRNCLYIFTVNAPKTLKLIIPLGRVAVTKITPSSWSIKNSVSNELLPIIQVEGPTLIEKTEIEVTLMTDKVDDVEMWMSALQHASGKGMRNSMGKRFYAPTEATTLHIGTKETKAYIVVQLVDALKKTLAVFKE
ncbi:Aste57867_24802 [Aphanomyces stellatus]|uniref:Aste57867_24802 protein n=1 Tax=Aphanomyces stellatus TaxID=120398 RepID=A0A485LVN8_9STRA|nr:hypothetical protein As57867_024724 [Aphanomyces stellatus]VFU01437.1 Aste57867_24802 [Aphanomyces stellatus]